MNIDELKLVTEKVNLYALGVLPSTRYEHSVRVAVLARELCERFGLDPYAGYLAGIGHDICKVGKNKWLTALALQDGNSLSDVEERKPALLHGRAAAVLMEKEFGVDNLSILEAVRHHTFGAVDMDDLGKIIFVSDKIEPGRTGLDPVYRAKLLAAGLDDMTCMVVEDNVRYLISKGKEVSLITRLMLDNLEGRKMKK